MTTEHMRSILPLLPRLDADDLATLKAAIKAIPGGGAADMEQPADAFEHDALECISTVLRGLGCDYASASVLRSNSAAPSFRKKLPRIVEFLEHTKLSRLERNALFSIGVECLYRNLIAMSVAVSPGTIMRHIHRLPAVLNQSFPGYAEAGLLRVAVNKDHIDAGKKQSQQARAAEKRETAGAQRILHTARRGA